MTNKDKNLFIVKKEERIIDVMKKIDLNRSGLVFCTENKKLIGVVSDGNIRRYLLKDGDTKKPVATILNKNPKVLKNNSKETPEELMEQYKITAVPTVNDENEILAIHFLDGEVVNFTDDLNIPVVINAGGEGKRLYPYTKILPKPIIPVVEKTITEIIMDKFIEFGCSKFNMIVNYKKELIKAFFNEVPNYDVNFIEEKEFLGTGGGLHLIKDKITETFFMSNCDILIDTEYREFIDYHKENKNIITIIAAEKEVLIPYGTLETENDAVKKINEKPKMSFLTNTGLYIIEPKFLEYIPEGKFIHITDVIEECIKKGERVGHFSIPENKWHDMGQIDELEKMREHLSKKHGGGVEP